MNLAPTPFEIWAADRGYDIAPAVLPDLNRIYADRATQEAFDIWSAGAASVARTLTESMFDTEALQERIIALAALE
jgi:hypothetical protein